MLAASFCCRCRHILEWRNWRKEGPKLARELLKLARELLKLAQELLKLERDLLRLTRELLKLAQELPKLVQGSVTQGHCGIRGCVINSNQSLQSDCLHI